MGDRTSMSVILKLDHTPTADERSRFDEINSEHYGVDWGLGDPNDAGTLSFGIEEQSVGDSQVIFDQLREAFPDAAELVVWEDPKYEWLGSVWRWKKGWDEPFTAECDAYGQVVLTGSEIRSMLDKFDASALSAAEMVKQMRAMIGEAP